jgi:hypothetical protein
VAAVAAVPIEEVVVLRSVTRPTQDRAADEGHVVARAHHDGVASRGEVVAATSWREPSRQGCVLHAHGPRAIGDAQRDVGQSRDGDLRQQYGLLAQEVPDLHRPIDEDDVVPVH